MTSGGIIDVVYAEKKNIFWVLTRPDIGSNQNDPVSLTSVDVRSSLKLHAKLNDDDFDIVKESFCEQSRVWSSRYCQGIAQIFFESERNRFEDFAKNVNFESTSKKVMSYFLS